MGLEMNVEIRENCIWEARQDLKKKGDKATED